VKDRVFSFHPHEDYFIATEKELIKIPPNINIEDAIFLPNVETAIMLVQDGAPLIGENVTIFGQGIVGLLTASIVSQMRCNLITVDLIQYRREISLSKCGAKISLSPEDETKLISNVKQHFSTSSSDYELSDLVFEISGSPNALNSAIKCTGYNGRIVVGSWYGEKTAPIQLGSNFHRSHMNLISSQVSNIPPNLSGRWSKKKEI